MIQAYNYMLESLPVKRSVRYPVSRKNELRRVYNGIVDLSKRSPLYKINLSKDGQIYTIGVKEGAMALKSKIKAMSDPEVSGFESKAVSVSDEQVLSASLVSENTAGLPQLIQLKVNSLAGVQVNKGKDLLQASRGLPGGSYKFKANIGKETYSLTYINETRKENQETLESFAGFLNSSLPGIYASVEQGSKMDYSRLVIASELSGRFGEKGFFFEDVDTYPGGIVDYFGMDRMEKAPALARFELNGISKQTATNSFALENALHINLHSDSSQPVTLKIVPDSERVLSAVGEVLDSCNDLVRLSRNRILDNKEHYKAAKLIQELKILEDIYDEELSSCGLKASEDGTLFLEEPLATQAARDGGMESLFTRENGFITRLLDKAEAIAINPLEYIEKTIVTYPDNRKAGFRNPYVTSMYSGLLFNSYC